MGLFNNKNGGIWATVFGIITFLATMLLGFGVITGDQNTTIQEQIPLISAGVTSLALAVAGGMSLQNILSSLQTTIMGVIAAVVAICAVFGVFSPETGVKLSTIIGAAITFLNSVLLAFTKDPKIT